MQVARNPLTSVKGLSAAAPMLDSLDASETPLVALDDLPDRLPRLTELHVRGCVQLTSLAALTPARCPTLSYLDASDVQLSPEALVTVCAGLAELDSLAEVHFSGTRLERAQRSSVEALENIALEKTDARLRHLLPQVPRVNGVDVCHSRQPEAGRQTEHHVCAAHSPRSCCGNSVGHNLDAQHHSSSFSDNTKVPFESEGAEGDDLAMRAFMKLHNIRTDAAPAERAPVSAALLNVSSVSVMDAPHDLTDIGSVAPARSPSTSNGPADRFATVTRASAAGAPPDAVQAPIAFSPVHSMLTYASRHKPNLCIRVSRNGVNAIPMQCTMGQSCLLI